MSTQCKNVFGFDIKSADTSIFTKTATFFNPADDAAENSISTQMTEDGKETPLPDTPEQQTKAKGTTKIYTIKQKVVKTRKSEEKERLPDCALNLAKVINSDDDKMWARYKSMIPHQQINLRTDRLEPSMKLFDQKKLMTEEADQSNALSMSNSESDSMSNENMFVIRSQKSAKKVMKFNKIKAIHPIPSEKDVDGTEEKDSPPKFTPLELRPSISSPPEYGFDKDTSVDSTDIKPLSSDIIRKVPIARIGFDPKLSNGRVTSANSTQKLPQIFNFKDTTPKEKKTDLLNSLRSEKNIDDPYMKVGTPTTQTFQKILFPTDKFCTPEKKPRIRSAIVTEPKSDVSNLELKALISPTHNVTINMNARLEYKLPPKPVPMGTLNNIDDSDSMNAKKVARFKTQEMVVNKIFNPANHRKKVS